MAKKMMNINEEWEKAFDKLWRENGLHLGYKNVKYEPVKDFIRTLYLQALEQGRTEGREEALREVEMVLPEIATERNSAKVSTNEILNYDNCLGWNEYRKEVLEALSKLRKA